MQMPSHGAEHLTPKPCKQMPGRLSHKKREREPKPGFIFQPKVGIHFSALVAIEEYWE